MVKSVLKKDVCKHCLSAAGTTWTENDEKNWRYCHFVNCPDKNDPWKFNGMSKICENPPEWCCFMVEHIV
jgi:hypothetical protein